jgi:hypothetical protein
MVWCLRAGLMPAHLPCWQALWRLYLQMWLLKEDRGRGDEADRHRGIAEQQNYIVSFNAPCTCTHVVGMYQTEPAGHGEVALCKSSVCGCTSESFKWCGHSRGTEDRDKADRHRRIAEWQNICPLQYAAVCLYSWSGHVPNARWVLPFSVSSVYTKLRKLKVRFLMGGGAPASEGKVKVAMALIIKITLRDTAFRAEAVVVG